MPTDFSNDKITQEPINDFRIKENSLRLQVNKSIAKLGVLTRNEDIYVGVYDTIIDISKTFDPFRAKHLLVLIDLQAELEPIYFRMNQSQWGLQSSEPFEYLLEQVKLDQVKHEKIQEQLTDVMR